VQHSAQSTAHRAQRDPDHDTSPHPSFLPPPSCQVAALDVLGKTKYLLGGDKGNVPGGPTAAGLLAFARSAVDGSATPFYKSGACCCFSFRCGGVGGGG
jgi:hypothetical protein